MHRVVQSHLNDFSRKFSIDWPESRSFEAFVNFGAFRSYCAEAVDPKDLVYDGDDPGIDGVMIFLDDIYVSSRDEVDDFFNNRRRDVNATIVFTQAKSGENWDKKEINTFQSAILDFLSDKSEYPHSEYIRTAKEVFDAVIRNVGKLRGGKPDAVCYFANSARTPDNREILAARDALKKSLSDSGLFRGTSVELLDRDRVVDLWTAAEGQVEATLRVLGSAAFPKAPEIEESYVVTVLAKDFVNQILTDQNGRLRQRIFEENVRDFMGSESGINSEITATLQDETKRKRFGVLNNGITIISPDIRITGFEIFLRDFQIVNGCQTSNVLFENKENISDDTTVMLKIVETSNATVVDDIVRSTNRQTKVEDDQFLATLDAIKALEKYFNARGADGEYSLYFERRKNQFSSHENVPAIRVFDIKEIARCFAAMFLDKPDIASRYPNRLTGELRDLVFNQKHSEEIYHLSAYTLYRIKLLLSNGKLDPKFSKLRWHLMMAVKYYVVGDSIPQLNSNKISTTCSLIESFISSNDASNIQKLRELCAGIFNMDEITRDRIKTPTFSSDLKRKVLEIRKELDPK